VWTIKESFFNYNIQRLKVWRLLNKLSKRLKFFENVNKQSELFQIETWKEWQKQRTPNLDWTFKKLKLLQEMQPNWHLHVPIQIGFNMVFHYHGKDYLIASPPTNMKNWMGQSERVFTCCHTSQSIGSTNQKKSFCYSPFGNRCILSKLQFCAI